MNILDQKFYTPEQAAPLLRQKKSTVWRWIRNGQLKASTTRPKLIPEREILRKLGLEEVQS